MMVIDSHLLSKRMPGVSAFMLAVSSAELIYGLLILYLFPLPQGIDILQMLVAIGWVILRASGAIIMFYNLQREEVSRVMPIIFTSPIFVALIAIPLLGENLGYLQWLAIIIVVVGVIVISAEKSPSGQQGWLNKSFLLLFVTSLLYAIGDIAAKYALTYLTPLNMCALSGLCIAILYFPISLRPNNSKKLMEMKRRNSTLALTAFNQMLVLLGMLLLYWALAGGLVALVSTIVGIRPVFVLIYSIILGLVFPGFLIRFPSSRVIIRFFATIFIVGGVSIIYLT